MIVIDKTYRKSKRRIKSLGILLFIITFPLIFNSYLFDYFKSGNNNIENRIEKESEKNNPVSSSSHPISADDFKFYKDLTINHTKVSGTANLIDFPVLISIFDSDLHDNAQPDGDDIAFANDFQWLDHEIELFNQTYNATHAHLVAWVRIPILSTSENTIIRIYFGNSLTDTRENPSGVWKSNYVAVWHLGETSGNVKDSTSYDTDGTLLTGATQGVPGQINSAYNFDGLNSGVGIGDPIEGHLDFGTNSFSVSLWLNVDQSTGTYQLPLWKGGHTATAEGYEIETNIAATNLEMGISDGSNRELAQVPIIFDQWMYFVGVIDRSSNLLRVYKDGVEIGSGVDISLINSVSSGYGMAFSHASNPFDGLIDEIRISTEIKSTDWIKTEYTNQNDPDNFYSISNVSIIYVPSIFDFQYFKEIIIDHTKVSGTNNLNNFPLLISLFDSDLHDKVQPDGDDIAFNNGTSWLFHEIEEFNQNYNSTHAQLIVWVHIPILSPSFDTVIRMYYGNSTMKSQENYLGVWNSNYLGIWHLSENGNGTLNEYLDSSGYYNHGQGGNGSSLYVPTKTSGMISYAQDFNNLDGKYDFIDCGDDPILEITGNKITLQAWVHHSIETVDRARGIVNHKGWYDGYSIFIRRNSMKVAFNLPGDSHQLISSWDVTTNEWHYVVATYDGSLMRIYIDGAQDPNVMSKTGNIEPSSSEKDVWIGYADQPQDKAWSGEWEGFLDEVRISDVARSADWIKTEYNNQYDPNSFYLLNNETRVEDDKPQDDLIFKFHKIIKIDHRKVFGSGFHSNFPVLISLFDSDLHDKVQPDGDDIAFALGSSWLDHEIEVFNKDYNGTHAQLVAWVRIPELSTSLDTYIRMYYGNSTIGSRENPAGVWDGFYKGVWHLAESSGVTVDSTSYNENGVVTGTVIRPSVGQIGNAYNYGIDGTFNVGDPADGHLDFTTESFMVSMWINIDTSTGSPQIPLYKGASSTIDSGYCFGTSPTGDSLSFHITDGVNNIGSPDASITFDSWAYIVGIVDRTNDLIRVYKDGYEVGSGTDISTIGSINGDLDFQCANPTYDFDGLSDEVRVLNETRSNNWIKTEYYNQYDPNSFYSIGLEEGVAGVKYSNLQINIIDLYGNFIPYANVSIYNHTKLIRSSVANSNGTASIINLIQAEYNFTVSIISDIGNYIEIVNTTSEAIMINQSFQIVNLICNVGSNFFEVTDIDGVYLDSGWIIVGNNSQELQNCSIDSNGHARFWWVNTTPYEYNYTVYYQDNKYNPNIIEVALGDIAIPNASIQAEASLTTIDFIIQTLVTKEPVSGVKCILTATNTGESIVNLTTDKDGKATLRWLNSTGINGNYSLQLEFFGALRRFNMTRITKTLVSEANFTVSAKDEFNIYIEVSLENYETELISLNPTEYISLEWGSQLKLRMLFNVSKAVGAEQLLGPTYSDIMSYEIFKGADLIQSGTMGIESGYIGTHHSLIDTKNLESDTTYLIFISAQKTGYSIPQDLLFQLNILKNNLILNQSENDDSIPSVYWSDNIDLSLKAYGEVSESFTTETAIFQNIDHSFKFFLSNINTNWNLTQITFNIYNISWNVNASDIYLSIVDPYGTNRIFNTSNHAGWDYNLGIWTGITIDLNKESPTSDNNFEFFISGTFDNTIDVIADAIFIRNNIYTQYFQYNISESISILSASEGWAINNVSFIIQNCYYTSNWSKVDLTPLTNLNITTVDGFRYSLRSGDSNGNGELIIDDRIIYPLDNQFLFEVESNPNIIFDVIIKAEFIQVFYQNQYLETLNISSIMQNIPNGGNFQLSLTNEDWEDSYTELLINGINNGIEYFNPSQLAMNITIGSQTYPIKNVFLGQGSFSLSGFNKDSLYDAVIEINQPVNFTVSLKTSYLRKAVYEILGSVTYVIRESPDISGKVTYYSSLRHYLQTIDSSMIDAGYYTVRFEITEENYNTVTKDLDIIVMKRLTLVNGESTIAKLIENMYVKDSVNFTFLYVDALTGVRITDLKTQDYMWEKYDSEGNVTANGEGTIIQTVNDSLVLDFDSEIRSVGDYLLIVTLEKENYEYKNAIIRLTINKRELDYSLGEIFENYQTSIVQGKIIQIQINLTDPTRGGIPLLNATVLLKVGGIDYEFSEFADGTYMLNFSTKSVKAFLSSKTLRGIINITREDYFSEEFFITIVVEMEEIFPGMPMFYFLILIFSVLALVGSIIGYRIYKHATIPTFVKNVREIKKDIKSGKEISESLLYSPKDVFIGEIVRDKWNSIGLSLGEIFGIEIKKNKKLYKPTQIRPEKVHDLKPLGLFLMKWDERIGTELLKKYPADLNIIDKTLMQVYSTHEYSGEKGAITLTDGSKNILSYYTGPESGYYIILFLKLEDDPDMYESAMANIAQIILQNLEDDIYLQMIPSLFQRLSVYPSLNSEQILIYYLEDEIKRMIINFLRDYGVITKSELVIWVKDIQMGEVIDLEAILADLIKIEIIKVASVKGIPSELIFLTRDIFMLRVPPEKIFRNPETHGLPVQFKKKYQEEVKKFFSEYYPTEEDNIKLLDVLIDPEVYQTLSLLRTAIATMKDFEKLKNKGVSDIYGVLKKLWDTNMIRVFKDENGIEYYTLLTDFFVDILFPKYLLNVIKTANDQKSKSDKVLLQYLNLLEETYYYLKSEK